MSWLMSSLTGMFWMQLMKPNYALHKRNHKKYVREFIDCDYLSELSDENQLWMSLFLGEYYDNSFKQNRLHNEEDKKKIGQINNERRRDIYALSKCSGKLDSFDEAIQIPS